MAESLTIKYTSPIKLMPPRQNQMMLGRPRVLELLAEAKERLVTILCASAGYGKTSLLTQFYNEKPIPNWRYVWLTLDNTDLNSIVMTTDILAAFAAVGCKLGNLDDVASTAMHGTKTKAILSALMMRLHEVDEDYVLILDDYHRAQTPQNNELLEVILATAPKRLSLVIASREKLNIETHKLFAQGLMQEIDSSQLSFSIAETKAYFDGQLSDQDAAELTKQTAGWPIALQLLRLREEGRVSTDTITNLAANKTEHLTPYLLEQVFLKQNAEVQNFLLETAQFEQIDCDVINAICDRSDSWEMFEYLVKANLFVTTFKETPSSYRYHNLFAEFLRLRLTRINPDRARDIHRKASVWYEQNQQMQEALYHALESQDYARATQIVDGEGGWLNAFQEGDQAKRLLKELPESVLHEFPQLQLSKIFLLAQSHDFNRAQATFSAFLVDNAIELKSRNETVDQNDAYAQLWLNCRILDILLNIYQDGPVDQKSLENHQQLIAQATWLPELTRALLINLLAYNHYRLGDLDAAQCQCLEAIRLFNEQDNLIAVYAELYLSLVLLAQGKLSEVRPLLNKIESSAQNHFGPYSFVEVLVSLLRAETYYEQNKTHQAIALFDENLSLLEINDIAFDIFASFYLTACRLDERYRDIPALAKGISEHHLLENVADIEALLRQGEVDQGLLLFNEAGLDQYSGPQESKAQWRWQIRQHVSLLSIRIMILKRDYEKARLLIDNLVSQLSRLGHRRLLIKVNFLSGLVSFFDGDISAAVSSIQDSVEQALGLGFYRSIKDELELFSEFQAFYKQHKLSFSYPVITFLSNLLNDCPPEKPHELAESDSPVHLTPRERQVILGMNDGLSNKEIAAILDITENTVKGYRKNVYEKLQVNARSHAIAKARALNLLA